MIPTVLIPMAHRRSLIGSYFSGRAHFARPSSDVTRPQKPTRHNDVYALLMLNYADQNVKHRGITSECPVPFGIKNGGVFASVGGGGSSARAEARKEGGRGRV